MRGPYQILWPLLSLFLVRVDLTDLIPLTMSVDILKAYDGDTVLVGRGSFQQKVRLTPIDAPEKGQPFLLGGGDAGEFSKRCLIRRLPRQGRLTIKGHDIYGRILGDINGVSLQLIQDGCCALYPQATFSTRKEKIHFAQAWLKARRLRRGVWAFGGFEQPKAWRKKNRFSKRVAHRQ
jgi:endonuclease YncB( thermonuclease family)